MNQPTNPPTTAPTTTKTGSSPEPGTGGGTADHRETVLLSDIPDAQALVSEAAATSSPTPNLSSNSLAALGQRYDILGEAGHGSMGNVYKARDRETGETVALKLLKPEIASDQGMMERFKNELLFARKITHKNVCRVHDFNRLGGIAYTSMEFVEGDSLRSVLNRFGGLPVRKSMDLALQICSGLKEAHAQGIVHRDLKPENVMVDAQGNVKIMDFGIARSMEAATRLTGAMVGTPAYMAPEQVAGKPVDYRTDIYSLGLMLYEMFTGSQAFRADTAVAVALKQMRETPPPPHEVDPNIPVGIERAILKCIEKEPEKRFQSIAELEKTLNGQSASPAAPIPATNVSTPNPGRLQPTIAMAARPPKPHARRVSGLVWALLGACAVLAALSGLHWKNTMQTAARLSPPVQSPAPPPPVLADEKTPSPPEANASEDKPAGPDQPTPPATPTVTDEPTPVAAAKPAPPPAPQEVFPQVEVARPKTPGEQEQDQAAQQGQPPIRPTPDRPRPPWEMGAGAQTKYIWVGRFGREDRAQETAKRLEQLDLPTIVIPRPNFNGQAFVVLTGPFTQKRADEVQQELQAKGMHGVRQVDNPGVKPTNEE